MLLSPAVVVLPDQPAVVILAPGPRGCRIWSDPSVAARVATRIATKFTPVPAAAASAAASASASSAKLVAKLRRDDGEIGLRGERRRKSDVMPMYITIME
mmetsp:Transcript_43590/g.113194  ORF Transcript_43590/g.113194 Transcript_43590/m.113194 type:complete len:100 (+) Transcript_43590:2508-2807(+)